MLLNQISVITDYEEAKRVAHSDLGPAEAALKRAEAATARCETERTRLLRLQGELNSALSRISGDLRTASERAYKRISVGDDLKKVFEIVNGLRTERKNLENALAWIVSFPIPDAESDLRLAEIGEKEAYCHLLESQAACARVRVVAAAAEMQALDPGVAINFNPMTPPDGGELQGGSWSSQAAQNVIEKRHEIERLKLTHRDELLRVQRERELVTAGGKLFT